MNLFDRISYEFRKGNSAIRQIIIICGAVFGFTILINIAAWATGAESSQFLKYFYLPSDLGDLMMRPWTIVTNIFFHSTRSIFHIVGNLIILYFIGQILHDFLKRNQVWTVFLGGGILGGVFFVAMVNLLPAFAENADQWVLLGASGGVTAIVVATGVYLPNYTVTLFGIYRIQMRWLAMILVGLDLVTLPTSSNAGGLLAHLGGAVFGALYILNLQGKLDVGNMSVFPKRGPKMKTTHYDESKRTVKRERTQPDQDQIDAILDKISQSGYSSLSKEEKEILFKASK